MTRPLDGLRVLDLTRLLPGPFATLVLADLGAEIIKIEAPPGGDYARYFPPLQGGVSGAFTALNRDKKSLALNLKSPEGRDVLLRLVESADVLIESFRPGVMARLGVGPNELQAVNPKLIYCAITGYGQTGPLSQRAGHDLNYLAISGLLSTGGRDGEVVQPGLQAADLGGGALYGVIGILAALTERHRTGVGRVIDASMTDGVTGFGIMMQGQRALEDTDTPPGGDLLAGDRLCYRTYRCACGGALAVGALEPKFWMGLCAAIGRPDLAGDGLATGERKTKLEADLKAVFASKTRDEWVAQLAEHDVCVEPVLTLDEAKNTPHAQARGLFGEHPGPGGTHMHQYPNPGLVVGSPPPKAPNPAPQMGQHTDAILQDAGYTDAEIAALRATKAVS